MWDMFVAVTVIVPQVHLIAPDYRQHCMFLGRILGKVCLCIRTCVQVQCGCEHDMGVGCMHLCVYHVHCLGVYSTSSLCHMVFQPLSWDLVGDLREPVD